MKSPSQSFPYWQVSTKALFAYWPPLIDELVPSAHCLPTHSLGNRPKYWQERGLPGKMRNSWVGPCWGNLPGKTEHREGKSFSAKIFHWRKIPLPSWIRDPGDLCCQNWGGHHHGQVQAQPSSHLCSNSHSRCCFYSAHEQIFSAQQGWSIPSKPAAAMANTAWASREEEKCSCGGREQDKEGRGTTLSTKIWAAVMWTGRKWPVPPNSWSQSVRVFFAFMALCLLRASVSYKP